MITFDEFKKIELVTAKIMDVRDHPNADKLLILEVDVGNVGDASNPGSQEKEPVEQRKRQIVAGIQNYYTKNELVGKSIVLVNNLEPAIIRGIQSDGMLLAASDEGSLTLLITEKEIKPGSRIR